MWQVWGVPSKVVPAEEVVDPTLPSKDVKGAQNQKLRQIMLKRLHAKYVIGVILAVKICYKNINSLRIVVGKKSMSAMIATRNLHRRSTSSMSMVVQRSMSAMIATGNLHRREASRIIRNVAAKLHFHAYIAVGLLNLSLIHI